MAEKWEVRELASNEFPETQLRYAVYDESYETVSVHFWEEDARKMAAVPLMIESLETAKECLEYNFQDIFKAYALELINAAITAAKGEL